MPGGSRPAVGDAGTRCRPTLEADEALLVGQQLLATLETAQFDRQRHGRRHGHQPRYPPMGRKISRPTVPFHASRRQPGNGAEVLAPMSSVKRQSTRGELHTRCVRRSDSAPPAKPVSWTYSLQKESAPLCECSDCAVKRRRSEAAQMVSREQCRMQNHQKQNQKAESLACVGNFDQKAELPKAESPRAESQKAESRKKNFALDFGSCWILVFRSMLLDFGFWILILSAGISR